MVLVARTAALRSVTQYEVDADGVPRISVLAMLRYRRFVDLATATAALGCGRKSLRDWELRRSTPTRESQKSSKLCLAGPGRNYAAPHRVTEFHER